MCVTLRNHHGVSCGAAESIYPALCCCCWLQCYSVHRPHCNTLFRVFLIELIMRNGDFFWLRCALHKFTLYLSVLSRSVKLICFAQGQRWAGGPEVRTPQPPPGRPMRFAQISAFWVDKERGRGSGGKSTTARPGPPSLEFYFDLHTYEVEQCVFEGNLICL